jgi:Iap family predicted aminopeptidase
MKAIQRIFFFILAFFLVSFSSKEKNWRVVFEKINNYVDKQSTAYENLSELISLTGHRLTGSEKGRMAEEFAFNLFKKSGYASPKYLPFDAESWSRRNVQLSVVPANSDNFREVEVVSLAFSPMAASVTAQIVNCYDGLPSDFERVGDALKGKIALFNINVQYAANEGKGNLHRSEKTALAIRYGAAGVIIANSVKGGVLLTGTASITSALIPIPAVCISYESGKYIKKWILDEKNILGSIDMLNDFKSVRARNVMASLSGTKKYENQRIVVGAHLDSWDLANGAIDNGMGAMSVMEVAKIFKKLNLKTKHPIDFVLFMGEEQGRLGSTNYVHNLEKRGELDNIGLMVNLDMTNNTQGFNASGSKDLSTYFNKYGKEMKAVDASYPNINISQAGLHSDHQSFMVKGIPVSRPNGILSARQQNCYHANCDSFDLIDKTEMEKNVKYTAMMLYALANEGQFPKRMNSEETKKFLIAQNLKEELVLQKNWPWSE